MHPAENLNLRLQRQGRHAYEQDQRYQRRQVQQEGRTNTQAR